MEIFWWICGFLIMWDFLSMVLLHDVQSKFTSIQRHHHAYWRYQITVTAPFRGQVIRNSAFSICECPLMELLCQYCILVITSRKNIEAGFCHIKKGTCHLLSSIWFPGGSINLGGWKDLSGQIKNLGQLMWVDKLIYVGE